MSGNLPRFNMFSELHQAETPDARIATEAIQFERERIKWLVKRLKIDPYGHGEDAGRRFEFTADEFNDRFSSFPFHLAFNKLQNIPVPWGEKKSTDYDYAVHRDPYSTEPARFKKFMWVPFVCAFQAAYDAANTPRPVAMVFPRKGFLNGMVVHNDATESLWTSGLSWVYKVGLTGLRIYVQPFSVLVDAIYNNGRGWRP